MDTPRHDIKRRLKFSPVSDTTLKASRSRRCPAMPAQSKLAGAKAPKQVKRCKKRGKVADDLKKSSKKVIQLDTASTDEAHRQLGLHRPKHHIMEFYTCPRLVPLAPKFGLQGSISLDVVHGWDALKGGGRKLAMTLLAHCKPSFLMLSPPCTFWSPLMDMWNFPKMSAALIESMKKDAKTMLYHTVDCCKLQHEENRLFCFEHPQRARSWKQPKVKTAVRTEGTYLVSFDQCAVGLKSPLGQPMRKRTHLWTNSLAVQRLFSKCQCRCTVPHRRIEGSELGNSLSRWAQTYPKPMIELLLQAAAEEIQSQ